MYIVICLELDANENPFPVVATRRKFRGLTEAKKYAATIDAKRAPRIINLNVFES